MRDYQMDVTGYTHGKGRLNCILSGYEPCHNTEEVIAEIAYDSETDIENPADSVFCSHGAGFVVKWDKVYDHMHIDGIKLDQDDDEEENVYQRANDYINMVADDNELMQIFERTYGPVRRKVASYTVKKSAPEQKKHQKSKPVKLGDEYLLVDGYNIIFAWDELKALAKDNLNMARDRLIDILCNYQGFKQCNLILVFDAYKVKGNVGSAEKIHNINVVAGSKTCRKNYYGYYKFKLKKEVFKTSFFNILHFSNCMIREIYRKMYSVLLYQEQSKLTHHQYCRQYQ